MNPLVLRLIAIGALTLACNSAWRVLGQSESSTPSTVQPEVAAIYFPGFHQDQHYDAWFGEGWNEWRLLEQAKPRFPGHRFLRPKWGAFDEASPTWMAKQIALAADHHIDAFIFDWYWFSGVRMLERPLKEGFLQATNRSRLKYALMWANHDWRNWFPTPLDREPTLWLPSRVTAADFGRLMAYCIDQHFRQPNYWRVRNGLFFGIFDPDSFISQLGGPEKAGQVTANVREQVSQAGLGKLYLAAFGSNPQSIAAYKRAGFDSTTTYNVTASERAALPDHPLDDYRDVIQRHEAIWTSMNTGLLPHLPVVTVGWDPSPRWDRNCPFPPPNRGYPYTSIITNNTPEQFGRLCRQAIEHLRGSRLAGPAILVNAWNEWTEGSALVPDATYDTGFLEELAEATRQRRD